MKSAHRQPEAYCLMAYQCQACGREERLWNSTAGVTPFGLGCRYCGGEAYHVRWHEDVYAPDFVPPVGSRIFAPIAPETALEYATRRVDSVKGTEWGPKDDQERERRIQDVAAHLVAGKEGPDVVEVTVEMHAAFARRLG